MKINLKDTLDRRNKFKENIEKQKYNTYLCHNIVNVRVVDESRDDEDGADDDIDDSNDHRSPNMVHAHCTGNAHAALTLGFHCRFSSKVKLGLFVDRISVGCCSWSISKCNLNIIS